MATVPATTDGTTVQPASNNLSLTLPTDFLTGSGGALNLNFNLGGNGTTIADSAYNFLNGSFANSNQFLGSSIAGTQSFIGTLAAPGLFTAANLGAQFTNMMPAIIGNLFGAAHDANVVSEQISANSTAASEKASEASIAESSKASGGGGMCFITTAICETFHELDDCRTLQMFRGFRDGYMQENADRKQMVADYYACAPAYVEAINKRDDAPLVYRRMALYMLIPALGCIEAGDNNGALAFYSALVEYARVMAHES